jgi:hypothetical protein
VWYVLAGAQAAANLVLQVAEGHFWNAEHVDVATTLRLSQTASATVTSNYAVQGGAMAALLAQ